jgi:hypothetical protein
MGEKLMSRRCPKCKGANTEEYAQTRTIENYDPDPWRCLDCDTFFHGIESERPADVDDEEWVALQAEAESLSKGGMYYWGWLEQLLAVRKVLGHWPAVTEGELIRWRPQSEGGPRRSK